MPASKPNLIPIFNELQAMLKKHSTGLQILTALPDSKAKEKKRMIGLVGKKDVAIGNRKPQPTYVCGIILQKHFVGFYSMPLYSHPKEIVIENPDVAKMKKGKSCINVTRLTPAIKKELERLTKRGIVVYRKEGWI